MIKYITIIATMLFSVNPAAAFPAPDAIKENLHKFELLNKSLWKDEKSVRDDNEFKSTASPVDGFLFILTDKKITAILAIPDRNNFDLVKIPVGYCIGLMKSVVGNVSENEKERVINIMTASASISGNGYNYDVSDIIGKYSFGSRFIFVGEQGAIISCEITDTIN